VENLKLPQAQTSRVERLLESYILHEANLPWGAYRMRSAATVPRELRGSVMQAIELGRTWSCWTDGTQTWLFTAKMSLELSREHGAPVLQVNPACCGRHNPLCREKSFAPKRAPLPEMPRLVKLPSAMSGLVHGTCLVWMRRQISLAWQSKRAD
jgi:hypothetical protein